MSRQKFFTPHLLLRNYVRYFWTFGYHKPTLGDIPLRIMADRFPKLIIQNMKGVSGIKKSEREVLPQMFVSGIVTEPLSYHISHRYAHLGVSFHPNALKPIFKVKSEELTDTFLDIKNLVPPNFFLALREASTIEEKIGLLTRYFLERVTNGTFGDNPQCVRDVLWNTNKYSTLTVKAIAQEHKLSERSIERKFKDLVGISPKKYLQLYRFESTYKNLATSIFPSLSQLGYENGFADQSHFIRNFKEYSGMLPTTFIEEAKKEREGQEVMIWNYTGCDS